MRRGEIWFADVPYDKRRPVVVLTRDSILARLETILVAPVTTRIRHIPTEIPVSALRSPSVANLDNITTLPKVALVQMVGQLTTTELAALCIAARFAINC
jgi:mRNA interferase MazF